SSCEKDNKTKSPRLGKWNYNRTFRHAYVDTSGAREDTFRSSGSFEFKENGTARRTMDDLRSIDYGWTENGSELLLTSLFDTIFVKTTKFTSYSENWEHSWNDTTGFYHDHFLL